MKKFTAIILTIAMLVTLAVVPSSATVPQGPDYTLDTTSLIRSTAHAGDDITVHVNLLEVLNANGLLGMDIVVEYNTSLVTPNGDPATWNSNNQSITNINNAHSASWGVTGFVGGRVGAGKISITIMDDNGTYVVTDDDTLYFDMTFTLLQDPPAEPADLFSVIQADGCLGNITMASGTGCSAQIAAPAPTASPSPTPTAEPTPTPTPEPTPTATPDPTPTPTPEPTPTPTAAPTPTPTPAPTQDPGKTVTYVSVKRKPNKITYYMSEVFDPTGLQLTVKYSDGTSGIVSAGDAGITYSEVNPELTGNQRVTISYEGRSAYLTIKYGGRADVRGIRIMQKPTTQRYPQGSRFDPTGMVVSALNQSLVAFEEIPIEELNLMGFDSSAEGITTVRVIYMGYYSTAVSVRITSEKVLASITSTKPTKVSYRIGEPFDTTGMVVTAKYYDSTTAQIPLSQVTITGYDNTTAGVQTINVTYKDKTYRFSIRVS